MSGNNVHRIFLQLRVLSDNMGGPLRNSPKLNDTLGDKVGVLQRSLPDLVEELVETDETWSLYIPMRLFNLRLQRDGIRQAQVQYFNHLRPYGFRQFVLCGKHCVLSLQVYGGDQPAQHVRRRPKRRAPLPDTAGKPESRQSWPYSFGCGWP